MPPRLSTGIDGLDDLLGGGLLPGTLTAVVGSTGIGKTQFGLQFANAGLAAGRPSRHRLRPLLARRLAKPRRLRPADVRLGDASGRSRAASRPGRLLLPCPALRRLFARLRPARPPGDAGRPRFRGLAAMAGGIGPPAERLDRVLLRQFRPRRAARRGRRHRAGRATERFDPVRAVRLHLPPNLAEGRGVGRPRPVPRALSPQRCGGGRGTFTIPARSAACC